MMVKQLLYSTTPDTARKYIPLYYSRVSAGFPSPAEDFVERRVSLQDLIIEHPYSTFFVTVEGDSMIEAGIFSGDILVVDKSIPVRHGCVIVAKLNEEFTVKYLHLTDDGPLLVAANPAFHDIPITDGDEFQVWGVVRFAIHTLK